MTNLILSVVSGCTEIVLYTCSTQLFKIISETKPMRPLAFNLLYESCLYQKQHSRCHQCTDIFSKHLFASELTNCSLFIADIENTCCS